MAVELVTGYSGTAHVGADEVRKILRSVSGDGDFYCEDAPTLSMKDDNTFHTTAFYAVCGGGLFRIEATDLAVDSGAQGVKRNDIVAVQYSKDSGTAVESASLVVIKGTAAVTAKDPTLTSGDLVAGCSKAQFAMARISLNGITVSTPTLLLGEMPSLELMSPVWGTIGRTMADQWTDKNSWLCKQGHIVTCHLDMMYKQSSGMGGEVYFTIPDGFKPKVDIFAGGVSGWGGSTTAMFTFKANGDVTLSAGDGGGRVQCDTHWPVA